MPHRFFLSPTLLTSERVSFPPEIAHQILHVLRLRPGQTVIALDNLGSQYQLELDQVDHSAVTAQRVSAGPAAHEPRTALNLLLCLTQREKFEWILQKATEIGVQAITPVLSARSLVQDAADVSKKAPRWEKILQEAAEQCGRGRIPVLNPPARFAAALSSVQACDLRLIPWEAETTLSLRQAMQSSPPPLASIALLIGPEGGFSAEEVNAARAAGFQAVTLGPRILRMETAAIVAVALTLYKSGDLDTPPSSV